MANHCYNHIEFTGTSDRLNALREGFVKLSKDSEYETFTEACDKSFGLKSPPDADYSYYGTKWFEFEQGDVNSFLVVYGDSAWGPPEKLTQELCRAYHVSARHEYEEPGCDFAGVTTFDEKGNYDQEQYTYWEFKYKHDQYHWWQEMIYLIKEEVYKNFDQFAEHNGYADLEDLNEAWNEAHKQESKSNAQ